MLQQLSSESRVWIFQADRFLAEDEVNFIRKQLSEFIPQWATHGKGLYGGFEVLHDLFIIVGVDESRMPPSGCSIDSMMHRIQQIAKELNVDFLNRLNTAYIGEDQQIHLANQQEFKQLLRDHRIGENTLVFNNLIQTKSELMTKWKTSVNNSWHKNLLELV